MSIYNSEVQGENKSITTESQRSLHFSDFQVLAIVRLSDNWRSESSQTTGIISTG